jgi:hypothetical protein
LGKNWYLGNLWLSRWIKNFIFWLKTCYLRVILEKYIFLEKNFWLSFWSIGHERATNREYISGENYFFGPSWSPSEERHIEHGENTFMSIKIDRVIRFCSTFFKSLVASKKWTLPIPAPPIVLAISCSFMTNT